MPAKIAVIIPARFASTRFPGKPLFPLAGKPMIQHVWEKCQKAKGVERVVVATDDMRIAEAAFAFGAEVAMTSEKCQSGTDRVAEVARKLKGFTHVINVQGDEPLVQPDTVTLLARTMAKSKGVEMITAASPFPKDADLANPNMVKVVTDKNGDSLYFSRSPIPYIRNEVPGLKHLLHHGIYGYSVKLLQKFVKWKPVDIEKAESLEQLRALANGVRIRVVEVQHASIGVDTPKDAETVIPLLNSVGTDTGKRSKKK